MNATTLDKAKTKLILDHPFYATLLMRMKMIEDPSIKTACTNGTVIKYNPDFFDTLTVDQMAFVLAHEVMHVASLHHLRRDARDPKKWNIAGDHVINLTIKDDDKLNRGMLKGTLADPAFTGMATEHIYNLIPEPEDDGDGEGSGKGGGNGEGDNDAGGCGGVEDAANDDGSAMSEAQKQQAEAQTRVAVKQAAAAAKARGRLPAALAELVEEITNPVLDWRDVLRCFIDQTARNDYSWQKPSRRHIASGLYLPSLHSEELKPIALFVDNSGSVSNEEMVQFAAEINDILSAYPCTVYRVNFDTMIDPDRDVATYTPEDLPLTLERTRHGGTDFNPCVEWLADQDEMFSCCIFLTDLECTPPEHEPDVPTLWVSTTAPNRLPDYFQPTFGEVAYL